MAFYALFAASLLAGERAWLVCSTVLIAGWSTLRAAEPTSTVGVFYAEPLVLLFAAGMLLARAHRTGAVRLSRPVAIVMAVGFAFIWWRAQQ